MHLSQPPTMFINLSHREQPLMWGVEISSGHGPREVKTSLQLSDRPLVDHVIVETGSGQHVLDY